MIQNLSCILFDKYVPLKGTFTVSNVSSSCDNKCLLLASSDVTILILTPAFFLNTSSSYISSSVNHATEAQITYLAFLIP